MAITNPTAGHGKLSAADFDAEIAAHGIDVLLRRGIRCPCANPESGQPDPNCDECEGWGMLWDAGATIQAYGPNRRINRRYEEPGSIDQADAFFSFPSETFIGHLDRFVVSSEIIIHSEIFTKGDTNPLTGATKEKTRFAKILAVERAVWAKRNPPTGHPYTIDITELEYGTDFEIVNNREINWLGGGSAPLTGARYSIRFRTEGEYLVWGPRGRAEGSQQLPVVYLCKRLDFIRGAV